MVMAVCLGPFQKFVKILSQPHAKIQLIDFYKIQVINANGTYFNQ